MKHTWRKRWRRSMAVWWFSSRFTILVSSCIYRCCDHAAGTRLWICLVRCGWSGVTHMLYWEWVQIFITNKCIATDWLYISQGFYMSSHYRTSCEWLLVSEGEITHTCSVMETTVLWLRCGGARDGSTRQRCCTLYKYITLLLLYVLYYFTLYI